MGRRLLSAPRKGELAAKSLDFAETERRLPGGFYEPERSDEFGHYMSDAAIARMDLAFWLVRECAEASIPSDLRLSFGGDSALSYDRLLDTVLILPIEEATLLDSTEITEGAIS